jgi:hypothetical protein
LMSGVAPGGKSSNRGQDPFIGYREGSFVTSTPSSGRFRIQRVDILRNYSFHLESKK